jgi:mannose/cellobiose epimerase-like protein (N-acyl-D-glucosamine 2-epimerase family)
MESNELENISWYSQGRILWVFSNLYNNFGKNPRHLEAVRQGKEALAKNCREVQGRLPDPA